MKLLTMNEWWEVCKIHRPIHVLEKYNSQGYWKSSNSEHEWRLIPQGFGIEGLFTPKRGHLMQETTLLERMSTPHQLSSL